MKLFNLLAIVLILVFGASFAALNAEPVAINYYLGVHSLPLSLLLIIALGLGGLLGILVSLTLVLKVKYKNRCLRKQIQLTEKEVANLRTLPLQDNH